jgi:hypothetical protein
LKVIKKTGIAHFDQTPEKESAKDAPTIRRASPAARYLITQS